MGPRFNDHVLAGLDTEVILDQVAGGSALEGGGRLTHAIGGERKSLFVANDVPTIRVCFSVSPQPEWGAHGTLGDTDDRVRTPHPPRSGSEDGFLEATAP